MKPAGHTNGNFSTYIIGPSSGNNIEQSPKCYTVPFIMQEPTNCKTYKCSLYDYSHNEIINCGIYQATCSYILAAFRFYFYIFLCREYFEIVGFITETEPIKPNQVF